MPTHLYLAPTAAGKTAYALDRARHAGRDLAAVPRVVTPSHLQARAARRRLAETGGAIGVRVLTFDGLYAALLGEAGETYVELSEPVQHRLVRAAVDALPLRHYAPLAGRPGFIQVLQRLIGELKAAAVPPGDFARAAEALGGEPRLAELAAIYGAYQAQLRAQGWADRAGLGWLAVEALAQRAPGLGRDWPLLAVDGFDSFTPLQVMLLRALAGRVGELLITLTGEPGGGPAGPAGRRFARTRATLERELGVRAEALPETGPGGRRTPAAPKVDLVEAPDRAAEARAALRWLKERIVLDGCRPGEVALLARRIAPYRPFILQAAAEFGLPVRLVDGLPLAGNPAIAALLGLLAAATPADDAGGGPALPRREVVEAWRSPYFDWSAPDGGDEGIEPGDADDLDAVARWGRVMGGEAQWSEALSGLAPAAGGPNGEDGRLDEERGAPAGLPRGAAAQTLRARFRRFVALLAPPDRASTYRAFTGWLETLIGEDAAADPAAPSPEHGPPSLRVVDRARAGDPALAERDIAALSGLKDVLRGLVWAEDALPTGPAVSFARFTAELAAALQAASYNLPAHADREDVLAADVVQARGLSFRAVAVLGLAEGEFPATLGEDPFLRDADRKRLREGAFGLPLEPSVEGAEAGFFHETMARPRERLLFTRPVLADNGATWQASPYWEEVRRQARVKPSRESAAQPGRAASWPELLESLAAHPGCQAIRDWARAADPAASGAVAAAVEVLRGRAPRAGPSPHDGDLADLAGEFAVRFAPGRTWSASRLESYQGCPFSFFVGRVLGLEPRQEPVEGLDARQLGNIYHHVFEALYAAAPDPADLDALLGALAAIAGRVLDEAPRREGFRATAWWEQTRREIEANVRRSVEALAALPGGFVPAVQEAGFFGSHSLAVVDGEDAFRVHGLIDRVDRAPDGTLRVIDYKTGGPWGFRKKAVVEGKKLQLPLYALAAEQALGLGRVVDGFYWHVQQAEPSEFTLAGFEGGPQAAVATALAHAWTAVRGARAGRFAPRPPDGGCPDYCAATAFCWRFRPGR